MKPSHWTEPIYISCNGGWLSCSGMPLIFHKRRTLKILSSRFVSQYRLHPPILPSACTAKLRVAWHPHSSRDEFCTWENKRGWVRPLPLGSSPWHIRWCWSSTEWAQGLSDPEEGVTLFPDFPLFCLSDWVIWDKVSLSSLGPCYVDRVDLGFTELNLNTVPGFTVPSYTMSKSNFRAQSPSL